MNKEASNILFPISMNECAVFQSIRMESSFTEFTDEKYGIFYINKHSLISIKYFYVCTCEEFF